MRHPVLALLLVPFLASAAAAQQGAQQPPERGLGAATATPEEILHEMDPQAAEQEMQRLIAAAAAFPLGSIDNPIRVGGPDGAAAYLARLRCTDGSTPRIGQPGEGGVGAFGTVTTAWPAACGGTSRLVVFDLYHEGHTEDRAAAGFALGN
jgi:hypothetical protein